MAVESACFTRRTLHDFQIRYVLFHIIVMLHVRAIQGGMPLPRYKAHGSRTTNYIINHLFLQSFSRALGTPPLDPVLQS